MPLLATETALALDVGCSVMLCAGLPSSVRSRSGQPCSPFEAGALPVLRPARRIHIRLRGRVLCNPPRLKGFRPARPYETAVLFQNLVSVGFPLGFQPRPSKRYAFFGGYAARNKAALGTSGRVRRGARGLGLAPAPCAAAPVVFAAIRAAMLRRLDTVSSPCDVSHRASDEPRRCMSLSSALAPSSLASPSIRRVFLRSICARRRSVSSLNLAATHPHPA